MKLVECLEIAVECGMETVGSAWLNVSLHALNIFKYDDIPNELNELTEEIDNLIRTTSFEETSDCVDVLKYLKEVES